MCPDPLGNPYIVELFVGQACSNHFPLTVGQYGTVKCSSTKATSLKNLVLRQPPLLTKSAKTELHNEITTPRFHTFHFQNVALGFVVEQAIWQLSLSISLWVRLFSWAGLVGKCSSFLAVEPCEDWSVPSKLHRLLYIVACKEGTLDSKSHQLCRLWERFHPINSHPGTRYKEVILSSHFQFKFPTLGNAFCVKFLTSQAWVMVKCPGDGMLKLWIDRRIMFGNEI